MKKRLLFILTLIFISLTGMAQSFPDCNVSAGNVLCGGVTNISGALPAMNTVAQPVGACNIAVHNGTWLSFVAGTPTVTLAIAASNCTPPATCTGVDPADAGIQSALFSGCGPNFTLVSCGPANIQPNTTGNFVMGGLTPGTVYHLLLDGFCNAVCDFSVNTVNGSTMAPPITGSLAIDVSGVQFGSNPPGTGCIGGTFPISAVGANGIGTYNWTLPDGTVLANAPSTINYTFGTGGQICVEGNNGCATTGQVCALLTATTGMETVPPIVKCPDDPGFATYAGQVFPPNGNNVGQFEDYTVMYNDPSTGCQITAQVSVMYVQPDITPQDEVICLGQQPTTCAGCPPVSGSYQVASTTPEGCNVVTFVNLTVLNPIAVIDPSSANEITCTQLTSNLSAVQTQGGGQTSYNWSGPGIVSGQGTSMIVVDQPGPYTLTVTQIGNGPNGVVSCTSQVPSTYTITSNTNPPTADVVPTATIDCSSGCVMLDASGSSTGPNIVYGWSGPNSFSSDEQNPIVCEPGNYVLTVFDSNNNCLATNSPNVMVGGAAASVAMASASSNVIDCNNATTTLDGSGSTNASSYSWTDASGNVVGTTETISVSDAGTYTLTVDNGTGCTDSGQVTITDNTSAPTATIDVSNDIDCNTTSATLTANSATSGLNYNWVDGSGNSLGTGASITVNGAMTVTLTVTDPSNNCSSDPITETVVDNSSTITADVTVSGNITCTPGSSVTLEATNLSGTSNPNYSWTDAAGNILGTGTSISVMSTGTYTVQIQDPNTGCSSGTITGSVTGDTSTPTAMANATNAIDCNNTSTTLDGNGSTTGANISYEWFDASGNSAGTGISLSTMNAGTYTLVVTNTDNGCSETSNSITVAQNNTVPTATIDVSGNIDCNNQSATLTANPSTGLDYSWVDGSGNSLGTGSSITVNGATTATLVVTDPNSGCPSDPVSATVMDNSSTVSADIAVSGDVDCDGNPVTLEVTNLSGTNNPNYSWTDAAGNVLGTGTSISVTTTGTYSLEIIDPTSGCSSGVLTGLVSGNTDTPTAMASSTNDLNCNNTMTTLSANGSSTGSNITYEWFDASGTSVGTGISVMVSNPGNYSVMVTNTDNNCDASTDVTVAQDDLTPTAVINGNDPLDCNTMSITLDGSGSTTTGGNTITDYQWLDASGNIVGTSATLSVMNPGDYTLNVTQSNGCESTSVSVSVVDNSTTVSVEATVSGMLTCTNTTATLDASNPQGATNPTYVWFDAAGAQVGTGASFPATAAGNYVLEITDPGSGCTSTATALVEENIDLPVVAAVVANNQPITCLISEVSLDGSGSVTGSNIEYNWTNASGTSVGTSALINVATPGMYVLEVLNTSSGCTSTATVTVAEDMAAPTADAGAGGTLDCGPGDVTLDGGGSSTGPNFTYEWFNASGASVGAGITFNASAADDYTLVVTNMDNGCSSTSAVASVVASMDVPNVDFTATNNQMLTCNSSSITLSGTSSTAGVVLEWQDALGMVLSSNPTLEVTQEGSYILVASNPANGCSANVTANVTEDTTGPTADAGTDPTLTCNDDMVSLNGSASTAGMNITYEWFDASNNSVGVGVSADVMTPGTYTLVVTNTDNGCTSDDVVEVLQDSDVPVVEVMNTISNINCDNTMATLDGTGSSSGMGIEYAWINASGVTLSTDLIFDVADPGEYTLMVTNTTNGCDIASSIVVTEDTAPPTVAAVNSTGQLTCTTLAATLDGTGSSTGTEIEYAWMDDMGNVLSTDIMFDVANPGTYTFQVTNTTNGCTAINNTVVVTQDDENPMAIVAGDATLTCVNNEATLDGTGSSSGTNFSYQWMDDMGNLVSTDLVATVGAAGMYSLIVTNEDTGCTTTSATAVAIDQDSNIPVAMIDSDPTANILTCENEEVVLDASSSTPSGSLTYEWVDDNGTVLGTGATLTVMTPGSITLNILDTNNSCDGSTSFVVDENTDSPTAMIAPTTALACNNTMTTLDGSMSSTGTNISYQWTNAAGDIVGTDATLDTDQAGDYILLVTNTDNGCDASMPISLMENFDAPMVDAGVGSTITCLDATATLNGSGSASGTTITYEWADATGMVVGTTANLDVMIPGDYTLTVMDSSNGCSSVSNAITVSQDVDLPTVNVSMTPISTLTCTNDVLTLSGAGSDSGSDITYEWTDPSGTVIGTDLSLTNVTTPGMYTLQVLNSTTGCSATDFVDVDQNIATPTAEAGMGGTLTCGTANFLLDGGASSTGSDITYQWLDANGNEVSDQVTFNAGAAGTYTLVVTDNMNGCSDEDQAVIEQSSEVPTINVAPSASLLSCATQMVTLDGSGSTLSTGSSGTLEFAWTDASGASLGATSSIEITGTGEYTLLITDSGNGCSQTTSITIGEDTDPPVAAIFAGSNGTLVCGQDDLLLDASGSTAGNSSGTLEYTWFDEAGNMVGTGSTYAATSAQTYTVEVLNTSNGCTNQTTQVVQQDNSIPTLSAFVDGDLTCMVNEVMIDGSASTSSTGTPLTYEWTDPNGMVVGTSATLNATAAGAYSLLITDTGNDCTASNSFTVNLNDTEPTAEIQAINGTSILCDMSSLVFNGSGTGSAGATLTYEWFLNGTSIGTMPNVEAGEAGTLMLVATDSENGCSGSTSITIDVDADVPEPNIATPSAITCMMNEVTIDATGSSQGAGLEYSWTGPGNITNGTTLTPTVDATGQYVLTISNPGNGCMSTASVMISADINPPTVAAAVNDLFDCVTSEISLDGSGTATGNVAYEWTTNNGVIVSGANSLSPLISAPGTYTLMVTDNTTGCTATQAVEVGSNTDVPVINNLVVNTPTCFGDSDGSIVIEDVTGGDGPYLFSVNGGAFAPVDQYSFLAAGNYEIVVQDVNGCESTEVVEVEQPAELQVELGDDQTIQLGTDYLLNPQIVGGYDVFSWSNCDSDTCEVEQNILPLETSQYSIMISDGNGCTATDMITIFVEKKREVYLPNIFTPNGDGENDFFLPLVGNNPEVEKIHEFRVFSRWGAEIYRKLDFDPKVTPIEEGWDGRFNAQDMLPQVFVFFVDVEFVDGRREILQGDVALRR